MMAQNSEEVPRLNVPLVMSDSGPAKTLDPCNVFVKYLPSSLDDAELAQLFASFGRILSSKIMVDPTTRKSLGFGFVRFSNASEANAAIESMDGHKMGTKRLLCKLANTSKEREHIPVSAGKQSSDDSPKGPRASASAGVACGSGLASSSSAATNPTAISSSASRNHPSSHLQRSTHEHGLSTPHHAPHSHSYGGHPSSRAARSDSISRASTSPANLSPRSNKPSILHMKQPSTNLYIKSLLPTDTEENLKELFGDFGEIVACKVMVDRPTGQSRRIGFVRYSTLDQATSAIQAMHGASRGDGTLSVKYADDERQKEVRKRLRQSASSVPHTLPSTVPLHLDPSSSASTLSQGHIISQPPYGMLSRHGSLEGRGAFTARPAPVAAPSAGPFLPVPWPYAWPTPVYTPIYESSHAPWLLLYPSDGFVGAARTAESIPQYSYAVPGVYYSVDSNSTEARPNGAETTTITSVSTAAPQSTSKPPQE